MRAWNQFNIFWVVGERLSDELRLATRPPGTSSQFGIGNAGMPMIDATLSVKSPDAPPEAAERWDTMLPPWSDSEANAEAAVEQATADYFDTEKWDEWFGLDESDTRVEVIVLSPESIAGSYSVDLERVTKAHATRASKIGR